AWMALLKLHFIPLTIPSIGLFKTTKHMPADLTLDRGLPQSIEAERSILGAILLENSLFNQAVELLKPEDFYLANNRLIFEQMLSLSEKSRAIDFLTLTEELENAGHLETVGGRSFV